MNHSILNTLKEMNSPRNIEGFKLVAVIVGALLLGAVVAATPLTAAAQVRQQFGEQQQWYDPADWFDQGGSLAYENEWFNNTYGYSEEPGEVSTFGYFGEEPFDTGVQHNYFTSNWDAAEGLFDF